jgi:hypothetical protein
MTHVKKMMLQGWQGHPYVECMVEVDVDLDALAQQLGEQAFRNKSKRSVEVGGLIKVRVRPTSQK